jgi:hypothetical protein
VPQFIARFLQHQRGHKENNHNPQQDREVNVRGTIPEKQLEEIEGVGRYHNKLQQIPLPKQQHMLLSVEINRQRKGKECLPDLSMWQGQ